MQSHLAVAMAMTIAVATCCPTYLLLVNSSTARTRGARQSQRVHAGLTK